MKASEQHIVAVLASILRIADGLDRNHMNLIKDLYCTFDDDKIMIKLYTNGIIKPVICFAQKKSDLLQKLFNKEVMFKIAD